MAPTPKQNHLLAALSIDTRIRLLPYLELVRLTQGKIIHDVGESIQYAYFPTNAIIAKLALLESGGSAEICMVGNEGVVGIAAFMGGKDVPMQAIVQGSGYAYRLPIRQFIRECKNYGEMLTLVLRYTQTLITQTAQIAMCNRHHSVEQQMIRILLHTLDRISGNELTVTQETIGYLLGVRRESITEAAGKIKQSGLIEYHRGRIKVLDRSGLEKKCCECYSVVRKETDRLLPYTAKVWPHSEQCNPTYC